nr:putative ribonuclease H-like domain-containing protein [Tanacetum cinerariifolium]
YRVVKALYGLHQAPRAWYARLSTFLLKHHYRRGTIDKTLFIKRNSRDILLVQVYVDDIIFSQVSERATKLRRLISWQCKKQTIVATSSTEAEYVAAASYCGQVLWIQNEMLDYGINFMNTTIFIDNQSTICIVKNPVFHQRTNHIEIRHYFIRDANEKNLIQVLKIHTDDNVADLLTKAFDGPGFEFLVVHIGMLYILPADKMVSAGRSMFLLVVIIPTGCFVPAGRYGLCWWLRVPAGRHTSAGRFISTGGCVFLLFSWFLLIVDSFCWLDTFMLLALFILSKHLYKLLNWFALSAW